MLYCLERASFKDSRIESVRILPAKVLAPSMTTREVDKLLLVPMHLNLLRCLDFPHVSDFQTHLKLASLPGIWSLWGYGASGGMA